MASKSLYSRAADGLVDIIKATTAESIAVATRNDSVGNRGAEKL